MYMSIVNVLLFTVVTLFFSSYEIMVAILRQYYKMTHCVLAMDICSSLEEPLYSLVSTHIGQQVEERARGYMLILHTHTHTRALLDHQENYIL